MQPVTLRKPCDSSTLPRPQPGRSQAKSNIPKVRRPQSVRLEPATNGDLTPRASLTNLNEILPECTDMASSVHTQNEDSHSVSPTERLENVPELRERVRTGFSTAPVLPKAKRIRFFRNGDRFFKGIWYALRSDKMKNMPILMEDLYRSLGDSTTLTHGIRHIFTIDGSTLITSIDEFQDGASYVCSSTDTFKPLDYQKVRPPEWKLTTGSRPNPHQETSKLGLNIVGPSTENTDFVHPRIITLIRHGVKPRKIFRHLLNKKTAKSFDQVMTDLTNLVKLDSGTIRKLYGQSGRRIQKLEDFFCEDDVFFAFGVTGKAEAEDLTVGTEESKTLNRMARGGLRYRAGRMPNRNESMQAERAGSVIPEEGRFCLPDDLDSIFHVVRLMGDGNTALVFEVIEKTTEERKALKFISRENAHGKENLIETELRLMKKLNHPYVVELFAYCNIDDSYYISMELVEAGDLFEYLRRKNSVSEAQAVRIANCLAGALCHIHGLGIVHRDLKLENLLIYGEDAEIGVKVADFGLACEYTNGELLTDVCGTPSYVAPEVLSEIGYGPKVDTWSSGVIIYAILCGFPPFQSRDDTQEDLFNQIQLGQFVFPEPYFDKVSYAARLFITHLLNVAPEARLSAQDMLADDWISMMGEVSKEYESIAKFMLTEEKDLPAYESDCEYYASRRNSMDGRA